MSLESSFRNLIRSDAGITAIVGAKVRPLHLAEGEQPPFITTQFRRGETSTTLADGPADYRTAEIELGVYSYDYDQAADVSQRLQTLLDGYGQTFEGIEYAPIMFQDETDIEESATDGEADSIFVRVQTYSTLYAVRS
jgi:hypothetical protein